MSSLCERNKVCVFFQTGMRTQPEKAAEIKNRFCMGNHAECARHRVHLKFLEGYLPPDNNTGLLVEREMRTLLPPETDRAMKIIGMLARR